MSTVDPDVDVTKLGVSGLRFTGCLIGAGLLGWTISHGLDLHQIYSSDGYLTAVTALLAVGIYGSTSGINLGDLRRDGKTIVLAITVGVLAKSVIIAIPMYFLVHTPIYALMLGVAVAQIDPLAVTALIGNCRMSDRAKTLLLAWSSFDDPVTMLLIVYLMAFAPTPGGGHLVGLATAGVTPASLAWNTVENLLLAAVVFGIQFLAKRYVANHSERAGIVQVVMIALLLIAGFVAVVNLLLFGLALIGLFLRPNLGSTSTWLSRAALLLATVALGMILVGGIRWLPGLLLGASAWSAQFLTAQVVARGQDRRDRWYLALGQQNGITAITLALILQPVFPGTVALIGPAVLAANLLHVGTEAAYDRRVIRQQRTERLMDTAKPHGAGARDLRPVPGHPVAPGLSPRTRAHPVSR